MNERKSKNVVIIALCLTLIFMGVGFAALSQELTINATATVSGTWDVNFKSFEDSTPATEGNQGTDTTVGTHITEDGVTEANVSFNLVKPGDSVQYTAVIENDGNITAALSTFTATLNDDYIKRTVTINGSTVTEDSVPPVELAQGETATVVVTYTFDASKTELPEFNDPTDAPTAYKVTDKLVFTFVQA